MTCTAQFQSSLVAHDSFQFAPIFAAGFESFIGVSKYRSPGAQTIGPGAKQFLVVRVR